MSELILHELDQRGRLNFFEFMSLALYAPGGYYRQARHPVGVSGDYYTSPALHPAFAVLLAVQVEEIWQAMGRPPDFDLLEVGGGSGILAQDLGRALSDRLDRFQIDQRLRAPAGSEPSVLDSYVRRRIRGRKPVSGQAESGPGGANPIRCRAIDYIRDRSPRLAAAIQGLVLGNEFLDALPFHRVVKLAGKIQELFVVPEGDRLVERPFPLSSSRLAQYVAGWETLMPEGGIAEAHLGIDAWLQCLAGALTSGVALFIDYAGNRKDLLARGRGTLRGYSRHRFADPLDVGGLGQTDITCHVDLDCVRAAASRYGMAVLGEASQADFLVNLGLKDLMQTIEASPVGQEAKKANLTAMAELGSPAGLGAFRVIALGKGFRSKEQSGESEWPCLELVGFRGGGRPAAAPLLSQRHRAIWGTGGLPGATSTLTSAPSWFDDLLR